MKIFRKALFWLHLTVGVIAGLVILIMSATGVLLTYERQITYWADTRNYHVTPPSPEATRLSVETLLARANEAYPGVAITTITLRAGSTEPVAVGLAGNPGSGPGGGRAVFIDPYTGAALGEGSKGVRDFFHVVTDWHRWLGASGACRNTARAVTGACNLGFLFIVSSGIYLWWPRKRNWPQFKNILWFKRGLPGKARDFNWHNVIGFWSFTPLFIVVLSALCGIGSLVLLLRRSPRGARLLAIGAVASIVWAWGVAQWPYILPTSLKVSAAAAPSATLTTLLVVFGVATVVIVPSLGFLYVLDQRSLLPEE
jgi:uncharacterized iron-regulated membrane protein